MITDNYRERLLRDLDQVRERVPIDRQVESPPEIAGPVIEKLRFLDPENTIRELFLNLLTASIDKERQSKVHPAFPKILEQLSRDEALLLKSVAIWGGPSFHGFEVDILWHGLDWDGDRINVEVKHDYHLPKDELAFADRLYAHLKHLEALNLIELKGRAGDGVKVDDEREPLPGSYAIPYKETVIVLTTPFGRMLAEVIFPTLKDDILSQPKPNKTAKPTAFQKDILRQVMMVAESIDFPAHGNGVVGSAGQSVELVVDRSDSCRIIIHELSGLESSLADLAVARIQASPEARFFHVFKLSPAKDRTEIVVTERPMK